MLGGVILVQQIEGHVLQPFLMGRFVSLHPLGVIVAIGIGVIVAGIAGALVAVPLAAAVNAVVQHLAAAHRRRRGRSRGGAGGGSRGDGRAATRSGGPRPRRRTRGRAGRDEPTRHARRHRGGRDAARRRRDPHAHGGRPLALGPLRRARCGSSARTSSAPGSFKMRGAYTRISRLTDEERARGVVAASAGNHAQGVALAAQLLGIKATVFMPEGAPIPKDQRHPRATARTWSSTASTSTTRWSRRSAFAGRDRRRPDPPLRPRRHRRPARAPAGSRSSSRCPSVAHRPRADRRRRAAGRDRDRASRRSAPTCGSSACRPSRRRGVPAPRWPAGAPGAAGDDDDDGRRHRRRAARAT